MIIKKIVPRRTELLRILMIVAIIFPMFVLLRGKNQILLVSLSRYLSEIGLLFFTLITTTKSLQLFHYRVSKPRLSEKNLKWQIITEILFISLITPISIIIWDRIFFPEHFRNNGDIRVALFIFFINLFILFIYLYYYHFKDSQERFRMVVANQERLKFEKITAQYKSLQNHISPHFIFNCLGGLDTMIRENPEDASRVIYNLSDCLQHILIALDKGTIQLEEELSFITKYEKLLQIRFPDSISISIFIDKADYQKRVPPCILQMLVENAVKHNSFDKEHKLNIIISSLDGNRLSVSNNCVAKMKPGDQPRVGTGLENIRQRFLLLTDEQLFIQQTDSLFTANLPLLNS